MHALLVSLAPELFGTKPTPGCSLWSCTSDQKPTSAPAYPISILPQWKLFTLYRENLTQTREPLCVSLVWPYITLYDSTVPYELACLKTRTIYCLNLEIRRFFPLRTGLVGRGVLVCRLLSYLVQSRGRERYTVRCGANFSAHPC